MSLNLPALLKAMADKGASDLHITVGSPPRLRIDGDLVKLQTEPLTPVDTKQLCYSVMNDAQKLRFEEDLEIDFSFGIRGMARFRANCYMQQACVAGCFRVVPYQIIPLQDLGMPPIVTELCDRPRGLVLVTGPTGSGKSTTLASMIDRINTNMKGHIVTVEDPIEFQHQHKNCLVNQREIGRDSNSFKRALKYILRQDPDVVLIGEMRDLETVEAALTIAETGHLAFGTLHTNSAIQSINRIIDVFPSHQHDQVRAVLSFVLEGVITQTLIPKASGQGRCLAAEVMVPNAAIRNLIREDKLHQIYSQMQIGQSKYGMQTMNQALCDLYLRKQVTLDECIARSSEPDELKTMIISAGGSIGNLPPPPNMRR
ncbi:MAG: type IV pilus twitching motility protein PilT [Deltaproteobacteria bacterium]|nr:type IV pilus twitching motility protein PilT [Deltaproteobacteria bacterium]MCW5804197.1 type IV pilus twitching motility protein PilT [Deltaproteobacteria bacterium]